MATFLVCTSVWFLLKYGDDRKTSFLFLSGALAAFGYYVRQSALAVPVIGIYYISINKEHSYTKTIRSLGIYFIGYSFVVIAFIAFYAQFYSLEQIVFSGLNPAEFIVNAGRKLWYLLFQQAGTHGIDNVKELIGTKTTYSFQYLKMTAFLHSFLFIGVGWAVFRTIFSPGNRLHEEKNLRGSYIFSLLWTGLLTAAYIYHYKTFGYYIDYFREFLPILAIIFAAYVWETIFQKSQKYTLMSSLILVVAGLAAIFIVEKFVIDLSKGVLIVGVIGAGAVIMTSREKLERRSKISVVISLLALTFFYFLCRVIEFVPKNFALIIAVGGIIGLTFLFISHRLRLLNVSLILSFMALSTMFAASTMDVRYDSIWSNEAVEKVSASIKENSDLSDEVMSGAVIWEFESNRKPFAMISHPSTYQFGMPEEVTLKIEQEMQKRPPQIIVLDSYTEKIYFLHLNWLQNFLDKEYELILENNEAKYPLRVFRRLGL
jgi:hypothetical protein